jgi:outer membrane protein assembly factor BamA
MAIRFSGGASFGRTPKQYFLGGTTNWVGTRTLEAKVYDVENLYFSDVVTPLRGQEYYGISGDRYGLINWELRFPMIQYFAMKYPLPLVLSNVTGAVFTDIGAAWFGSQFKGGTTDNDISRLQDIKAGFGVGMRINLFGFALLRYDVAWATDLDDVSDKPTQYFSLGADF